MSSRWPSIGLLAVTALALVLFFGLAALGWGSVSGLLGNPARAGTLVIIAGAAIASLFTGINLGGCVRADARDRWKLAPLVVVSLGIAVVPPASDRREWLTIDGDTTRWLGMALVGLGAWLRVGPMFVLGRRFTWPLASQDPHPLLTTGFYRWIRHPSYLGAFLGAIGWTLTFRSAAGLALVASLLPAFLPVLKAEEDLLVSEYGDQYKAYQCRTWRLIPFLY